MTDTTPLFVDSSVRRMPRLLILAIAICSLLASGCVLGPQSMRHSRMNYNRAVQVTAREEMLLNLVRMRYHQSVDFLRVPSITSQFRYATNLGGSRSWANSTASSLSLGGSAETKPTVVYTPEQEQEFNTRLFSPISLETVKLLSSQGWAINRIGRISIKSINGVENAIMAGGPTPTKKPDFEEFLYAFTLLRQVQMQGQTVELVFDDKVDEPSVRSSPIPVQLIQPQDYITAEAEGLIWKIADDGKTAVLQTKVTKEKVPMLRMAPQVLESPEYAEFSRIFGLKPGQEKVLIESDTEGQLKNPRYLKDGSLAPQDRESLMISTRSLYEMMFYISHSIEVPCEHIEQGLVRQTFDEQGNSFDWNAMTEGLFKVKMSKRRPVDSAVSVKHRGHWFYIESNDLDSKSTFNLILELFNLEIRAGGGAQIPLLTL